MTFESASQFHVYLLWGQRMEYRSTSVQHSVLIVSVFNVKALVGTFNQEKASVIVKFPGTFV